MPKNTVHKTKNELDLVCIGETSIDLFLQVDEPMVVNSKVCFPMGAKIEVNQVGTSLGGNAPNVAVGATKLGLNCSIFTYLGNDLNSQECFSNFERFGLNTALVQIDPENPTNMHVTISTADDRTIFTHHQDYKYQFTGLPKTKWVYYTSMPNDFESFQEDLLNYLNKKSDIGLLFNPGTMQIKKGLNSLKNILKRTNILILNNNEAKTFGANSVSKQKNHEILNSLGPQVSVITYGKEGSSAWDGKDYFELTGFEIDREKIKDKTGAGDAFSAGFLAALHNGKSIEEALKWGTKNSAGVVTQWGATNGQLNLKEIKK